MDPKVIDLKASATTLNHYLPTYNSISFRARWVIESIPYCGPIEIFLVHPVPHNWCNKGHGMCYPVCGMVHIKEPLLLIGKSMPCGGSGFPLSLSEWSFTICLMPYNCK